MRWFVGTSLRFRHLVVFLAVVLVLFGMAEVPHMPVDAFPEFAPPIVEVQSDGPGMSTVEVEELLTIPLEQAFAGTPGLDVMRSKSVPGTADIRMIFKLGTDPLLARQVVEERLAPFAAAGNAIMVPPLSSTSRVMKIGISSKTRSLMDLSMTGYWTVRFRLMQVPGVANVPIWGERIKELNVLLDPKRLRAYNVSVQNAMDAGSDALDMGLLKYTPSGKVRTGGFFDTPNQRLEVSHRLPIIGPEDLARVAIQERKKPDGTPLRMGDIGNVVWDTWPLVGDAVVNGHPGLLLVVEKFPWANTLDVTRGVEAALNEMKPGLPGIEFDTSIFRPAAFIETAVHNLTNSLLLGALLVVLVILAFLYEWRIALVSCTIIPVSLMAALLVLDLREATLNVMVLAGLMIAIGAVVDDAIVGIENILRRLRQARADGRTLSLAAIVLDATVEVRGAIIYASLIEIAALLPVFFMGGLAGAFFRPLAVSYALAVLASTVVALTLTPALSLMVLSHSRLEHRESPLVPWLHRGYNRILAWTLRNPRTIFAATGVIVLAGVAALPFLGQSLFPDLKERDFLVHWVTRPGTSLPEMVRSTTKVSHELLAVPGVRSFGAHMGRALLADEIVGVNAGENWISVDPGADYDKTVDAIHAVIDRYPGIVHDVETYLHERVDEVLTGSTHPILVKIFGPDLWVLRAKAEEVREALSGIPGLVDVNKEFQIDVPVVQVKEDLRTGQRYGLKPGDVRRIAATFVAGFETSDIHRDNKVYDVWTWSIPEARRSPQNVREIPIDTPRGGKVPLAQVADVSIQPMPSSINRENRSRRITVEADVHGRDLGAVARDVERALQRIQLPLEYHAELAGEYAERQAAQQSLLLLSGVAVIVIFSLLLTSFGHWRLAMLTFWTLPSALVGGILAAFATGRILSLGSLVGFLTVLGIVARNGIMLMSHYHHLEQYEGETFGPGLVMRGARERLRPILMTMAATALALVPLVVAGNIPGHEIEYPMAIVILGGLVTSTLMNLFVVPAMYLRLGRDRNLSSGPAAGAVH
ncbi:MAG: efflux RND transporter permease subunit [Bacillati bacterium ANGP1]|uniref:Efflux RND transporter permease subunit n=1 Tax=Candidatus Segetimicrobium genomatis TaxID=2569760 RepID=A0A537LYY3_9BACT|nr:MAG: efflux RND transporter permease subunit [Terrabacteria group bacterium ANGP1]